jgi:hypothetical protein
VVKIEKANTVAAVAIINLIVYIVLMVLLFSFTGGWESRTLIAVFGQIVYLFVGVLVSFGLIQRIKWSWYLTMMMWIIESGVLSWVAIWSGEIYLYPFGNIIFIFPFLAVLRIAFIGYFATKKVRESFNI